MDLAWAGPDALYVSEALAGRVLRVDLASGDNVVISDGLEQPEGLTMLADGRVAVVEVGAQRVIAIDVATGESTLLASGLPVGKFAPEAPAPVHVPSGIVEGADGVLYLTSDREQSVLKLIPGAM